jgi:hypothetical protein
MLYFLQNLKAGYLGNSPMFWAKGGNGYTQWIDNAEQMTADRADEIYKSDPWKWRKWPVDQVEAVAQRTVDMQRLGKRPATEADADLAPGSATIHP